MDNDRVEISKNAFRELYRSCVDSKDNDSSDILYNNGMFISIYIYIYIY
jgi:hypothetical protein